MLTMFRYNWQIRDQWFERCKDVPVDELLRERTGGVGSILHTLYHIVVIEAIWILGLQKKAPLSYDYSAFDKLDMIKQLSGSLRGEIEQFILSLTPEIENKVLAGVRNGKPFRFLYGEVVRHVIAHEIHHIGQLSVWARELEIEPVSANLVIIDREFEAINAIK